MDTSKMKHLEKKDSALSNRLLKLAKSMGHEAAEAQDALETSFLREQIVDVVETYYDIGSVTEVFEIFGGYINRSFGVVVEKDGVRKHYFLRRYKLGITDKEIQFEHSMITHSISNGLSICPGLISSREGTTYVTPSTSRYKFAIYDYLEGEDKYTWDNPIMEDEEYACSGEVLATLHNATRDFDPAGLQRVEPKILEFAPTLAEKFLAFSRDERPGSNFYRYFMQKLDVIMKALAVNTITAEDAERMPLNAIHCDFHPGNLKFIENQVVGLFDFDWAKIDLRLFDVCFAMVYNSVIWGGQDDGVMLMDKCRIFVQSYQDTLERLKGLSPMNPVELKNFPVMTALANLYLLNWTLAAYFAGAEVNDDEYLAYLEHNVRQMEWIEEHKKELEELAESVKTTNR